MARADKLGSRTVNAHIASQIALLEVVFSNALHLLKNITDLEICRSLDKSAFTYVVDLLEVEDAVQDALGLIEGLLGDGSTLLVEMPVQLLQVHERDL